MYTTVRFYIILEVLGLADIKSVHELAAWGAVMVDKYGDIKK